MESTPIKYNIFSYTINMEVELLEMWAIMVYPNGILNPKLRLKQNQINLNLWGRFKHFLKYLYDKHKTIRFSPIWFE